MPQKKSESVRRVVCSIKTEMRSVAWRAAVVMATLEADTALLRDCGIYDYSLLVAEQHTGAIQHAFGT